MIHDLMAKSKRRWQMRTRGLHLAPLVQTGNRFKGKNASGSEGQDGAQQWHLLLTGRLETFSLPPVLESQGFGFWSSGLERLSREARPHSLLHRLGGKQRGFSEQCGRCRWTGRSVWLVTFRTSADENFPTLGPFSLTCHQKWTGPGPSFSVGFPSERDDKRQKCFYFPVREATWMALIHSVRSLGVAACKK